MDKRISQLKDFLDSAHSTYHAVSALSWILEEAGYTYLSEQEDWHLTPGGKYYLTKGGSSLIAFRIPYQKAVGFMISASHADRPAFKVKENGELAGTYTRLATERYGGMIMGAWLDRPLSVAGRVMVETPDGIEGKLIDIDRDLLLIPSVAIHMNRKVNEGYAWNPAVDTLPLLGDKEAHGKLRELLEQEAGGKILGHDLYLYVREKASVWGIDEAFLSGQALDDLECAWCCTRGFLDSVESSAIPVLTVFDSEEIGSRSPQGAGSTLLEDVLHRICRELGVQNTQMLNNTLMLSADNAHAVHPNHPEYADAENAPVINGGIVLKYNADLRYATDGVSGALLKKICRMAEVPVQTYYNRADLPGGSTLGSISLSHVSVPVADVGLPQLAMHSCYETAGTTDVIYLQMAMRSFYSCAVEAVGDGAYRIL